MPWSEGGQASFCWTWLGAVAARTRLRTIGPGVTFSGEYYQTRKARLFTPPAAPIPLYISSLVPHGATFAGTYGDGLITVGIHPTTSKLITLEAAMSPENSLSDQDLVDVPIADEPERAMDEVSEYFPEDPPVDSPVLPGGEDNAEIPGAIEDGDLGAGTGQPGDDEIAASVRRLLRMDALTSMLPLTVYAEQGVVTLFGSIQSLDDADNAAAVAAQAPGVLDVVDAMDVR